MGAGREWGRGRPEAAAAPGTTQEPANNPRTSLRERLKSAAHALGMSLPRKKHQPSFPSTKKHRDKNRGTTKNRGHQTKEKGPKRTTPKTHDTHRVGAGRYSLSANHRTSHSTCSILCATLSHRGSRFAQRKYAAGTPHAANMAAKGYGTSASKVGFRGVVEVKKP